MGVTTPDIWGGNRTPEQERYASSILALNATTGKLAWSYQTVHHDLWDMDLPAQPTLADNTVNGQKVPVIYAPAKTIVVMANWWFRHRKNRFPKVQRKAIT